MNAKATKQGRRGLGAFAGSLVILLLAGGCTAPIGADRVSTRRAYEQVTRSALTGNEFSDATKQVMHRYDMTARFSKDPAGCLREMHAISCRDNRRELLYALAEMNFLHAGNLSRSVKPGTSRTARDYYLASAIYSWQFLLGGPETNLNVLDRRIWVAADLHNRALAHGFIATTNSGLNLQSGARELPAGPVAVECTRVNFKWKPEEIETFEPADNYLVRGLSFRDRLPGLGAPLIVVGKQYDGKLPRRFPATLFMRVSGNNEEWSAGRLKVTVELHHSYDQEFVEVNGRKVPLEVDTTAPLGYALSDSFVWQLGLSQFFSPRERVRTGIYFTQTYEPGRVPVVFVHGTASSPVWWAEMWNTLRGDPVLRDRVQFWYFIYNSGNPVSYSAANLRDELMRKVRQLDPEGKDPALRQMVVIGHSQGGLLAKLTVTDSGEALWRAVSKEDFDNLNLTAEEREALRRNFFFEPLPCVSRVVFVATPHRGSYLATTFVRKMARTFMRLPQNLVGFPYDLVSRKTGAPSEVRRTVPTSIDGMSPKNPYLLALADLPPATNVTAHSIIAIRGDDRPPEGGDGVVKYRSAHVPYVESEFIVHSTHSCQGKPQTIEEVRRILLEHVALDETAGLRN